MAQASQSSMSARRISPPWSLLLYVLMAVWVSVFISLGFHVLDSMMSGFGDTELSPLGHRQARHQQEVIYLWILTALPLAGTVILAFWRIWSAAKIIGTVTVLLAIATLGYSAIAPRDPKQPKPAVTHGCYSITGGTNTCGGG